LGCQVDFLAVEQDILMKKDIKFKEVYFAQVHLDKVLSSYKSNENLKSELCSFKPISKFPPVIRDITILVRKDTNPAKIIQLLSHPQILIAELTDTFSKEKIGIDNVALTFRLIIQDLNSSLKDEQADCVVEERLKSLSKEVQFTLR
jgi:phenylalanyl-tRNA synthetase beta chain